MDETVQLHRPGPERLAPEAREGEQIVDQLAHLPAARAHHGEEAISLRVELAAVILFEHLRITVDRPQRRAQIVRNRIGKCLQLLVGGLQFLGALVHAQLKLIGMALDALIEPRLADRDRELGSYLARDAHLLVGKRARFAAEADCSDQLAAGDHGHHHVNANARGEQRVDFRPPRQCMGVDHLRLASF